MVLGRSRLATSVCLLSLVCPRPEGFSAACSSECDGACNARTTIFLSLSLPYLLRIPSSFLPCLFPSSLPPFLFPSSWFLVLPQPPPRRLRDPRVQQPRRVRPAPALPGGGAHAGARPLVVEVGRGPLPQVCRFRVHVCVRVPLCTSVWYRYSAKYTTKPAGYVLTAAMMNPTFARRRRLHAACGPFPRGACLAKKYRAVRKGTRRC